MDLTQSFESAECQQWNGRTSTWSWSLGWKAKHTTSRATIANQDRNDHARAGIFLVLQNLWHCNVEDHPAWIQKAWSCHHCHNLEAPLPGDSSELLRCPLGSRLRLLGIARTTLWRWGVCCILLFRRGCLGLCSGFALAVLHDLEFFQISENCRAP